jgi:hypothetical protein
VLGIGGLSNAMSPLLQLMMLLANGFLRKQEKKFNLIFLHS